MRQIKFRGKRTTLNGEWVFGDLIHFHGADPCIENNVRSDVGQWYKDAYTVAPDTIGQYTGLRDRNGEEIYEGDIVQWGDYTYSVVYKALYAAFGIERDDYTFYFGDSLEASDCEVIGNVTDNPELLEGGEE